MKKSIIYGVALALAGGLTACDSYLDINENPNNAPVDKLTTSNIFPGCETAFMNMYGGTWHYMGAFQSWQFAQAAAVWQWGQISRGDITNETGNGGYYTVYVDMLGDIKVVLEKAEAEEDWGTYLAATTLRVAALQCIVDAFGDAPYSEALDITNQYPKWDSGADVYAGLLSELNTALDKPFLESKAVCTSLLYGSDASVATWIKVANAVKLRMLMRISNVQNVQSELAALIAEDNFPTNDVKWTNYTNDQANKGNPFWGQFTDNGNHAPYCQMNIATQKVYEAGEDLRMERYWKPASNSGAYVGWLSGCYPGNNFASNYNGNGATSNANLSYDDPIYWITVAEIEFFKAEYYARIGNHSEAQSHYEDAIYYSFGLTAGLDYDDAESVIEAWPYDQSNWAKCIGIQKWLHLTSVNGYEGWCELRRLKYPAFGSATGDEIIQRTKDASINMGLLIAGDIYTTPSWERSSQLPANTVIQRWIYPSQSSNNNPNTPKPVPITTPIFWAAN